MRKAIIYTGLISLFIFVIILGLVSNNGFNFLEKIDLSINQIMPEVQNSFFTEISKGISFIFDIYSMIVISFIVAVVLWLKRWKKEGVFFALIMIINAGFIYLIKEVVQRARPLNAIINETGFAFPSGHATTSVVFFGLLCYLTFKYAKTKSLKIWVYCISILMILLIGFSRIYLNIHWLSDVLGGFLLGGFILLIGIAIKEIFD